MSLSSLVFEVSMVKLNMSFLILSPLGEGEAYYLISYINTLGVYYYYISSALWFNISFNAFIFEIHVDACSKKIFFGD